MQCISPDNSLLAIISGDLVTFIDINSNTEIGVFSLSNDYGDIESVSFAEKYTTSSNIVTWCLKYKKIITNKRRISS
jgi:hypothetical protein